MKSFLLLILLLTDCEASYEVTRCQEGEDVITCKYPNPNREYNRIGVVQSTKKDEWKPIDNFSLYHDTINEKLWVSFKQLQHAVGMYKCKFHQETSSSTENSEEVIADIDKCPQPFIQTAYRTARTTMTCDYPGDQYESKVKFFCKETGSDCKDILSTKSLPKSKGTFTLTVTNSSFSMSISNVSSHDAGVYWCGVKSNRRSYLRKIQLEVEDIRSFTESPTIGQTLTYWCEYPDGTPIKKFICKGEDPSKCQRLVSTAEINKNTRFSMRDDRVARNITITLRELTANDTGTYWCGAERTNKTRSDPFFHRLLMTVVPPPQPTSSSLQIDGGSWLRIIIVVVVCGAVLVLVLIVVLVYKRLKRSKNIRNGEAQNDKELLLFFVLPCSLLHVSSVLHLGLV